MIAVDTGGKLYIHGNGTTIANGLATPGNKIRINTVHDANAHELRVYVNGKKAYEDDNAPGGEFYDKIGTYATEHGKGPLSVSWTNVQFWTE